MGKIYVALILLSTIIPDPLCYSQSTLEVSDPRLELAGNTIQISYDILNSTPAQEFTVDLIVRDDRGNIINATALTGDVGDKVNGGTGKQITWDLEADRIEINADIFIKVYAKAIPLPEPIVEETKGSDLSNQDEDIAPVDQTEQETLKEPTAETDRFEETGEERFSRNGIIIQSLAIPGLGLTRVTGKPHWLRAIAGYGCLAGSIVMNQAAVNTYEGIIDQAGYDAKNTVYKKSLKQDQVSEMLAYAAIAIWVSDLIWTVAGTSDLKRTAYLPRGFKVGSAIDPFSQTPMLAFSLKF